MQRVESHFPSKQESLLSRAFLWLVSLLGYAGALCVANRPRFWWQEVFCSLASYWLPLAVVFGGLLFYFRRCRSRIKQFARVGALVSYIYLILFMGAKAFPYLYYQHPSSPRDDLASELRAVWIDGWSEDDSAHEIRGFLKSKSPAVVIMSGEKRALSENTDFLSRFAHHARTASVDDRQVLVASDIPFGPTVIQDLGIESLAGGFFSFQLQEGQLIELGAMVLLPSTNQGDFERNRITSRRLSSLIRNSQNPRIVTARFATTPFSRLMAIYPEQARVSSLRYGEGLHALYEVTTGRAISQGGDVFISKEFTRLEYERLEGSDSNSSIVFFRVQLVPLSHPASVGDEN